MKTLKLLAGICLVSGLLVANALPSSAWGAKGHDIVCSIAQDHLSAKARRQVDRVFGGKSLVYWAKWLDNASHTPAFSYTSTWHYKNIDAGESFETARLNEAGDVLTALDSEIKALKSGTLNPEAEAIALRIVIHLMGDLHCPMHMGHLSDRGGNRWQVQFFNRGTNLHSVWDGDLVEAAHKWTHSEWAEEIDRLDRKEVKKIMSGTLSDWGRETFAIVTEVYENTPVGTKISYDYIAAWTPVIETQMLKGGLRLAAVLNDIYR